MSGVFRTNNAQAPSLFSNVTFFLFFMLKQFYYKKKSREINKKKGAHSIAL